MPRPTFALMLVAACAAAGAVGCFDNSSEQPPLPDGGLPDIVLPPEPYDAHSDVAIPKDAAVPVPGHQAFAVAGGGVRAESSAHAIVTTSGDSPGGNTTLHSPSHTIVGGFVGATQKP